MNKEYIIAPGETLLELLETNSMSQLDLAMKTGINKKTINEIIKGKAPITTSTSLKLEYVFNIPASFWNNLESNYRESIERMKDTESLKEDIKYLKDIPYTEMAKRNWDYIEKTKSSIEKVKNLRKFFSVASLSFNTELKKKIAFRKSDNDKFSYESLYCWLRYGEIQANKIDTSNFDINKLKGCAKKVRNLTSKPFIEQLDKIKEILSEAGVSLIFEPHLPHTFVNGISYKASYNKAIIMISDRGKKDDILWFTLFHEIGHLIKHSKKEMFIDSENSNNNKIEIEANEYAKNILINEENYKNFINNIINENSIKKFAIKNNISPGILVGRLQNDHIIGWNDFNHLITRI